jgi:hypothetical protein
VSGDYGLGYKVHEDAYCELEEELAKAKSKLEEVGFRACCVLLERDEAREQRDRLVDALELLLDGLLTYAPDYMHGLPKRHYVDEAMEALAAVKGGKP